MTQENNNRFENQRFNQTGNRSKNTQVSEVNNATIATASLIYISTSALVTILITYILMVFIEIMSIYIGIISFALNILVLSVIIKKLGEKYKLTGNRTFSIVTMVSGVLLFIIWIFTRAIGYITVIFYYHFDLYLSQSIEGSFRVVGADFIDAIDIAKGVVIVEELPEYVWYIWMVIAFVGFVFPILINKLDRKIY